MMKKMVYISFLSCLLLANNEYWAFHNNPEELTNEYKIIINEHKLFYKLDQSPLVSLDPLSSNKISFPTLDQGLIEFYIYKTPVMPESLSKKYPMIKTYSGIGTNNPNDRISITLSSTGAKILILKNKKRIFIQKISNSIYKVSYFENKYDEFSMESNCSVYGCSNIMYREESHFDLYSRNFPSCVGEETPCYQIGNNLVTFRYAGIMTAEANNEVAGGTVEGGLSWMAAMVNQINLVWIRELSFRLELIENNDLIIYTDNNPTPDVFTYYNMYDELPLVLGHLTEVIGPGGYGPDQINLLWEYGAVFNIGYGGGLAYVPGSTSANLPSYGIHIHEIGHNLGSGHNCTSENGWKSSFGGTAMCNRSNTLATSSGDQYSSHTIDIAIKYQQEMFYGNNYDYQMGWEQSPTLNNIPELFVPISGFTIPKQTPFVLEGYATDEDPNSQLTYSWEQNDASNVSFSPPDYPSNSGPLFCSVDANPNGNKRYFPQIQSLFNSSYSTGSIEELPFASREINMRLLVRDNNLISGGFNYKNVKFFVDENSGPFRVTSQDEEELWEVGSEQIITWDVANTDNVNSVNCQSIDILLSINESDFDVVLEEGVSNSGSYSIIVPPMPSNSSTRIMVKCSDNIFFDINNAFITIENNNIPQISLDDSEIDLILENEATYFIERNIENSGDPGSILTYTSNTEIDLNGDGFLSFDGLDDYVDLGSNLLSGQGEFSISLWVKSLSTDKVIMQQRNGGFNGEYQIKFNLYGQINFWSYSDGYQWTVTSPESFNDNQWHHIVIVQDLTINGGRLYIDGVEQNSNSNGLVTLDGSIHTYLGADMRDYVNYLQGDINDVNIFSTSLPASDINILFNTGFGFNPTYNNNDFTSAEYLVASYPISQMSGNILFDLSNNGFDGFISGAVWNGDLEYVPSWLNIYSQDTWLESGNFDLIQIEINTEGLTIDNEYQGKIIIESNSTDSPVLIPVNINIIDGIIGDVNMDGTLDILDIVFIVNLVLLGEFNELADINSDYLVNVLDIIQIVSLILE